MASTNLPLGLSPSRPGRSAIALIDKNRLVAQMRHKTNLFDLVFSGASRIQSTLDFSVVGPLAEMLVRKYSTHLSDRGGPQVWILAITSIEACHRNTSPILTAHFTRIDRVREPARQAGPCNDSSLLFVGIVSTINANEGRCGFSTFSLS